MVPHAFVMAVADVEDLRDVDVAVQLERPLAAEVLVLQVDIVGRLRAETDVLAADQRQVLVVPVRQVCTFLGGLASVLRVSPWAESSTLCWTSTVFSWAWAALLSTPVTAASSRETARVRQEAEGVRGRCIENPCSCGRKAMAGRVEANLY
ncbi:hypothetical protein C4K18_2168 [Pseudomonas chlororaphis subsp. aurantiaca]|nr:hypothetical protein C4K18_2168 [Pseudomonas chlororaphis subsp. aurantiaca]